MKKTKLMFALLAGLTLGACSSDNDEQTTQQPPQPKSYPLTIEVTENPLVQDGEESSSRSNRAAITTGSTLSAFNLDYVYGTTPSTGTTSATKNGEGKWTSEGIWPGENNEVVVNWYASTAGTFNLTDDASKLPYINFTVDENVATQKDLLVATASGTSSGTGGKLSFTFDHACAALRFHIKKSTNLDGYKLDVSEVVLCNILNHAKYYYATGWNDFYETRSVYTLFSGSQQTLGSGTWIEMDGGSGDYLFLIPQTLTPWDHVTAIASATTQTYLKVRCTITRTSDSQVVHNDSYAYIPFDAALVGGKKYDVKINIGKNSLYSGPNTKIIN